jgi:hypothetical protein
MNAANNTMPRRDAHREKQYLSIRNNDRKEPTREANRIEAYEIQKARREYRSGTSLTARFTISG